MTTALPTDWQDFADRAAAAGRAADLLVLADDAPGAEARADALCRAGALLLAQGQAGLADEQFSAVLAQDPQHAEAAAGHAQCAATAATPPPGPRRVLLFSGHMVDAPTRAKPRFPASRVAAAAAAIDAALADAGPADLALTQGAAGGDLLFAEACQRRGVPLQLLLPLAVDDFIAQSVLPSAGGDAWRARFHQVMQRLAAPPRVMPHELGPSARDVFVRCNLWLLATALAHGPERVQLVCLWDGGGGDGPGGTAHMVQEVQRHAGRVQRIDPGTLG